MNFDIETLNPYAAFIEGGTAARIVSACARSGLDLAGWCRVEHYNREVPPNFHLPDGGEPHRAVIVIGNTRALWPHFLDHLREDPERMQQPDPIDNYVEQRVHAATAGESTVQEVRFSHELPPRLFAAQRLAHVAGLAHLGENNLCVHPVVGPWLALRAAVILDEPGPEKPPALAHPCGDCTHQCAPLLQRILASNPPAPWTEWLALRESCPVGQAYRYSDAQIHYHYLKQPELLRRAVEALP